MDDETKLTLHGLQQHYEKVKESDKNKKLFELLDVLEFNQVILIFFFLFFFEIYGHVVFTDFCTS